MKRTAKWVVLGVLVFSTVLMADYKLFWAEEFDDAVIDSSIWQAEVNPGMVYNSHQRQFYTDRSDNSFIKDGNLVIQARKDSFSDCDCLCSPVQEHNVNAKTANSTINVIFMVFDSFWL